MTDCNVLNVSASHASLLSLSGEIISMMLSFLQTNEIYRCSLTCKRIYQIVFLDLNNIWFTLYVNLLQLELGSPTLINLLRKKALLKVKGIKTFIKSKTCFQNPIVSNLRNNIEPKAGMVAGLFECGMSKVLVQFGGATNNFRFTNTFNCIEIIDDGVDFRCQVVPYILGPFPPTSSRWLAAGCMVNNCMYVTGGETRSEDILGNFMKIECSCDEYVRIKVTTLPSNLPHLAGHVMVYDECRHRLITFGGKHHLNGLVSNDLYYVPLHRDHGTFSSMHEWIKVPSDTTGDVPSPRWCHQATVLQDSMIIFGGWEYSHNVFLNDLYMLNLECFVWSRIDTHGVPPSPRCQSNLFHCKNSHIFDSKGYLIVFGGASRNPEREEDVYGNVVNDFGDFHLLDLDVNAWVPLPEYLSNYEPCRGGVNATVELSQNKFILCGGMHSDPDSNMPEFRNNMVFVTPDL